MSKETVTVVSKLRHVLSAVTAEQTIDRRDVSDSENVSRLKR